MTKLLWAMGLPRFSSEVCLLFGPRAQGTAGLSGVGGPVPAGGYEHGCCWDTFFDPIFASCGLVVEVQPLNC